jgi:predicted RNase H-like HicB family nuclease
MKIYNTGVEPNIARLYIIKYDENIGGGCCMKIYNYTVVFEPVAEGGYNVIVPAIPEICTSGETLKEAKAMVADAIKCYIESALKANEPIPEDREPSIERVAVRV